VYADNVTAAGVCASPVVRTTTPEIRRGDLRPIEAADRRHLELLEQAAGSLDAPSSNATAG
jgi:hypothetical protein